MLDDYALNKVLDKIKRTEIGKLNDTNILIDTDDKLPDDITIKNVVMLMTSVMNDGDKFYTQLFLEEALFGELTQRKALKKI